MAAHSKAAFAPTAFRFAVVGATYSGAKKAPAPHLAIDVYFGGPGVVSGTVAEKGDPANKPLRRRVVLIAERSRQIIRETWSDRETGAYAFAGLDATKAYTSLAFDYENHYRPVASGSMTPEVAP